MSRIPRTLHLSDAVWRIGPTRGRNRFMLLALLHEGGGQADVKVTHDRLCHLTCTATKKSARDTLRLLEADGWLTIEYQWPAGAPNTYHLNLDRLRGEES
jgi:hypothetical protein